MTATGIGEVQVCYTVTRRGAPSLVVAGHSYVARKRRGPRVYWSCRSRAHGCPARALTAHGRLKARVGNHTHPPHELTVDEHARIESLIETIAANN